MGNPRRKKKDICASKEVNLDISIIEFSIFKTEYAVMEKSTIDLQSIARSGGSIKISAKTKSTIDLQSIARSLTSNGELIITDSAFKSTIDLQSIARSGGGKVLFDFT